MSNFNAFIKRKVCKASYQLMTPLILLVGKILLQYTPAQPPNLVFLIKCGRLQISLSKAACSRMAAGCAPLA